MGHYSADLYLSPLRYDALSVTARLLMVAIGGPGIGTLHEQIAGPRESGFLFVHDC